MISEETGITQKISAAHWLAIFWGNAISNILPIRYQTPCQAGKGLVEARLWVRGAVTPFQSGGVLKESPRTGGGLASERWIFGLYDEEEEEEEVGGRWIWVPSKC
jgi:hypothetical protein